MSRCDWGLAGHDSLAPADVVIVIDVLSFSTCDVSARVPWLRGGMFVNAGSD
ncbi:MAG TPA: hypothetical protein VFB92_29820 [Vicinamibacterales bacterium]|nr:hypothetical protein [Vicinamibacterales bacterium]